MTTPLVPFRFSASGRVAVTSDDRTIAEQQILDVVVTGTNERVMRPEYGAGLNGHVFDPMGDLSLTDMAQEIMTRCSVLSTCKVMDVQVRSRADDSINSGGFAGILDVTVLYRLPAHPTVFEMKTSLTNYITVETPL